MAVKVDTITAWRIFDLLVDARLRKTFPYNLPKAIPPQVRENLPASLEWGSREHALFLFALCYWMRGGIESDTATKALTKIYELQPLCFLPEWRKWTDTDMLEAIFDSVGLGFNKAQIARLWMRNLAKLEKDCGSDPRNLFEGISKYEDALELIQNKKGNGFGGFQEKMVSMVIYFFMDAGMIDSWNFPPPVDFHVLRIAFAHEILKGDDKDKNGNGFYTKPVLAKVRELLHNYCVAKKVDPLILCEALWIYSRIMCSEHPGNTSIVGDRNGRKTEITPIDRWTMAQVKTYDETCERCLIRDTCRHCVPSATYYIGGRIELRGKRDEPPALPPLPLFQPPAPSA